jgi:uncharacterized repeat protein (TIGR03803 family)
MNTINKWSVALAILVALTGIATELVQAQVFTTIHAFSGTDGAAPVAPLIQATDGNLYGTTVYGGANGDGTVFKITTSGTLTTVYSFCEQPSGSSYCLDGNYPTAPVIEATNGDFYGITGNGGANCENGQQCGTVFSLTPRGKITTLYSFCSGVISPDGCLNGEFPGIGLVEAANGDFYGTTTSGGADGYGSVFKITHAGVLSTEVSFDDTTDGADPNAGLVQATNGFLYGTTSNGAAPFNNGTVFKITENGKLTTLLLGFGPSAATLIQATDGNLYGSTSMLGLGGTIFKITPGGDPTTLYDFCSQTNCADGSRPWSALTQGSDGNFYGVTEQGGVGPCPFGCGTIFKLTPSGDLTTLYSFCAQGVMPAICPDGYWPFGLMQATDGNFYGATAPGGGNGINNLGNGTVYRLSVGLGPFVALQTAFGKVGATVKILGTRLIGVTSVTFNGTPATFTVNATRTAITATVPTGATTGTVSVATRDAVLSSNKPYTVLE